MCGVPSGAGPHRYRDNRLCTFMYEQEPNMYSPYVRFVGVDGCSSLRTFGISYIMLDLHIQYLTPTGICALATTAKVLLLLLRALDKERSHEPNTH